MNNPWSLPTQKEIGGVIYDLHTDYRDILEIFYYFDSPELPEFMKWKIALALFYGKPLPEQDFREGAEYLSYFINGGQKETGHPGPKLLDWQQDAPAILADMNKVAGREIRAMPYLHWWTFLAWFHGCGEGQLSMLLTLRRKLRKGEKLQKWEQDFYRENKDRVDLPRRYSRREQEDQKRILAILGESKEQ